MIRTAQAVFMLALVMSCVVAIQAAQFKGERQFTGTINKTLRIKMTLTQDGQRLTGSYLYEKVGKDIALSGSVNGQQITLREYDNNGNQTGTFQGRFVTADSIEGTWTNADGTKSFPFSLLASGAPAASTSPATGVDGKYQRVDAKGRIEKESGAEINIKTLANGMTQIEGVATLVVDARRGNVRTGTVGGQFQLAGNKLFIKEGDDESACKMTIVFGTGKLEVTEDNGNCGGLGVSFIGNYKRTGAPIFQ